MVYHDCQCLNKFLLYFRTKNLHSLSKPIQILIEDELTSSCTQKCAEYVLAEYLNHTTNIGLEFLGFFLIHNNPLVRYSAALYFTKNFNCQKILKTFLEDEDARIRMLGIKNLPLERIDIFKFLNDTLEIRRMLLEKIKIYIFDYTKSDSKIEILRTTSSAKTSKRVKISGIGLISEKILKKIMSMIHDSDWYVRQIVSEIITYPLNIEVDLLFDRNSYFTGAITYGLEDENPIVRRNMLKCIIYHSMQGNQRAIQMLFDSLLDEDQENRFLVSSTIEQLMTVQHENYLAEKYIAENSMLPIISFLARQKNCKLTLFGKIINLPLEDPVKYWLIRQFSETTQDKMLSLLIAHDIQEMKNYRDFKKLIEEFKSVLGITEINSQVLCGFSIIIIQLVISERLQSSILNVIHHHVIYLCSLGIFINQKSLNEEINIIKEEFLSLLHESGENSNSGSLSDFINQETQGINHKNTRKFNFLMKIQGPIRNFIEFFTSIYYKIGASDDLINLLNLRFRLGKKLIGMGNSMSFYEYFNQVDFSRLSEISISYKAIGYRYMEENFVILKITDFKMKLNSDMRKFELSNCYKSIDPQKSVQKQILNSPLFEDLEESDFKYPSFSQLYLLKVEYKSEIQFIELNSQILLKWNIKDDIPIYTRLVAKNRQDISITPRIRVSYVSIDKYNSSINQETN